MTTVPDLHIRSEGATYGTGDGSSFENALSGFEDITGRVPPNTTVKVHEDQDRASVWPLLGLWNNGVRVVGVGDTKPVVNANHKLSHFEGYSGIRIENMEFHDIKWNDDERSLGSSPVETTPDERSSDCTFINSTFLCDVDSFGFNISFMNDRFTWHRCDISGSAGGLIYFLNLQKNDEPVSGADCSITYCHLHDTHPNSLLPDNDDHRDGHAIGINRVSGLYIAHNLIENTRGAAIEAFRAAGSQDQEGLLENVTIINNVIDGVTSAGSTLPRGIAFTSNNPDEEFNTRTGCIIAGNWIRGTEGDCIGYNAIDDADIYDNDLFQPLDAPDPTNTRFVLTTFSKRTESPKLPYENRIWYTDQATLKTHRFIHNHPTSQTHSDLPTSNVVADASGAPPRPTNVGVNG